jgi:hypothetical protein
MTFMAFFNFGETILIVAASRLNRLYQLILLSVMAWRHAIVFFEGARECTVIDKAAC